MDFGDDEAARLRLAAIVESSDDAIVTKTLDGIITSWNPAAEAMFGYTAAEAVGRSVTLIVPPERLDEEAEVLAKLRRGERVSHFETIRVRKDGARLHISLSISPMKNAAGEIIGASKIARDITDRKHREAGLLLLAEASQLLSSSLDYEATLSNLTQLAVPWMGDFCAVDMVGEDGSIRRLAATHVDPPKTELANRLLARDPLRPAARYGVPQVIRTGRAAFAPELPEWFSTRLVDTEEDRAILRALGFRSMMILPLTTRYRTIGAMTVLSAESGRRYDGGDLILAQELARRAAIAIENATLYRRADEANRAKDHFLAVLSHELRTPLTAIRGWVRMLQSGTLSPEKTAHALAVIDRNVQVQTELIEDLLDISRVIAGKLQMDRTPVDLVRLVQEVVEQERRTADEKGLALTSALAPLPAAVLGDPVRLRQVVLNLVSNALKFTPPGGRIDVRLEQRGGFATLIVADTGEGVEPHLLARIFDAFVQTERTEHRQHSGLGLGLSIVRSLVEAHGGRVRAESAGVARGTTFTVELPLLHPGPGVPVTPAIAPAVTTTCAPTTSPLRDLHVLVVDDHADSCELVSTVLEQSGAIVHRAASVDEALGVLRGRSVDVLVSDIGMPGKNGYDLIREVRTMERGRLRHVPAIALTAYAGVEHRQLALSAGFEAHAAKPVDPDQLRQLIARAVHRGGW